MDNEAIDASTDDGMVKLYEPQPPPLTPFLTALKSLPYELAPGHGGTAELPRKNKGDRKGKAAPISLPPLRGK